MSDKCWCGGAVVHDRKFNDTDEPCCVESPLHDPFATGGPKVIHKLYVAGPMTGYPEANYPAFDRAAEWLESFGYEVVNPTGVHIDQKHHYVDLLWEDLRVMLDCHGIAVLDKWWESTGARNEVSVAGLLRMPVRPVGEWVNRASDELGDRYYLRRKVNR
jgi:hypothetical protein